MKVSGSLSLHCLVLAFLFCCLPCVSAQNVTCTSFDCVLVNGVGEVTIDVSDAQIETFNLNSLSLVSSIEFYWIDGLNGAGNATEFSDLDVISTDNVTDAVLVLGGNFTGGVRDIEVTATFTLNAAATLTLDLDFTTPTTFGDTQIVVDYDIDLIGSSNDYSYFLGTPGDSNFTKYFWDPANRHEFSHVEDYSPVGAVWNGWAFAEFNDIENVIESGGGYAFTQAGDQFTLVSIDPVPGLPFSVSGWGPDDMVHADSFGLNSGDSSAFLQFIMIPTILPATPTPAATPVPPPATATPIPVPATPAPAPATPAPAPATPTPAPVNPYTGDTFTSFSFATFSTFSFSSFSFFSFSSFSSFSLFSSFSFTSFFSLSSASATVASLV